MHNLTGIRPTYVLCACRQCAAKMGVTQACQFLIPYNDRPDLLEDLVSKKDYIAIAKALDAIRPTGDEEARRGWSLAVRAMLDVLQRENPRFDGGKFVRACHATDIVDRDPTMNWALYYGV